MRALILETSTEKSCLILSENGEVRKSKFLIGGPELSKRLAWEVDSLLKEFPGTIDFITVGQGPGSYTGTRVGASLAKGLSFGWEIPLYGFCSLKSFCPKPKEGPFAIIVDAKMGGLYILLGKWSGGTVLFGSPELIKIDSALSYLTEIPHLVSPHPAEIEKRLPSLKVEEADPDPELLAIWAFSTEFQAPLELSYLNQLVHKG